MVACWAAAAPPEGSDGEVEDDEEDEEPEPVAVPTPGVPPLILGQPVVSPVESGADGPHGYVGAALRLALLSPTSRALARLRRTLE